ncbi:DUF2737 family protein [Escherichia coli]|nr:DUF2737 family protein [Escherichia coli]EFO1060112.1 DUF2737 family protein [Escherichia coli]EIE4738627.1 DUF2737 family protein [Escherichia coli]
MRGLAYNPGILPAEMIIRQRVKPMPSIEVFYLNSPTPLNADFFYLNSLRRVLFYGDDKCTSESQVNGMESHSTELSKQRTSTTAMTTGCCGRR